jgi:hypothetical protein
MALCGRFLPTGRAGLSFTVDNRRTVERVVQVGADIRVADVTMKIGARNESPGLMPCAAQDQASSGLLHRDD